MQFSLLLLSVIAAFANAIPSLAFLDVPKLKSCTAEENMPGYKVYCLPQAKPEHCPLSSWKQLTESTLPESQHWIVSKLLPLCSSAIPNFRSCTVEKKDDDTGEENDDYTGEENDDYTGEENDDYTGEEKDDYTGEENDDDWEFEDNYTYLCIPQAKPEDCPSLSWKQLKESTHLQGCERRKCGGDCMV